MDANSDGRLEAGELDAGKRRGHDHRSGSAHMESVVTAKYADFLTEQVKPQVNTPDVATLVLEKLDGDQSGGLNSEEIAGTRLAEIIGGDFYQIDADKDGALNKAELAGFVTEHLLGSAQGNVQDASEAIGPDTEETAENSGADDAGIGGIPADDTSTEEVVASPSETADIAAPVIASDEPSAAAIQAQNVATAFETALEILKSGTSGENPYDVVMIFASDKFRGFSTEFPDARGKHQPTQNMIP
jgi:hypothetical protein